VERNYDRFYPLTKNDQMRVCAWWDEQWSKDKKTCRLLTCDRTFPQWNQRANTEPWAMCPKHARDDREKPKK
jgi:hypothetical protein